MCASTSAVLRFSSMITSSFGVEARAVALGVPLSVGDGRPAAELGCAADWGCRAPWPAHAVTSTRMIKPMSAPLACWALLGVGVGACTAEGYAPEPEIDLRAAGCGIRLYVVDLDVAEHATGLGRCSQPHTSGLDAVEGRMLPELPPGNVLAVPVMARVQAYLTAIPQRWSRCEAMPRGIAPGVRRRQRTDAASVFRGLARVVC